MSALGWRGGAIERGELSGCSAMRFAFSLRCCLFVGDALSGFGCSSGDDQTHLLFVPPPQLNVSVSETTSRSPEMADAGAVARCAPAALRCVGREVERCELGAFTHVDTCVSEHLCEDTVTQCQVAPEVCADAVCLPPVCEVGERRCNGNLWEICNEGLTAFVVEENCGPACGGRHCDVSLGCAADECIPSDVLCSTEGLVQCNEDCSGYARVPCESLDLCDFCGH